MTTPCRWEIDEVDFLVRINNPDADVDDLVMDAANQLITNLTKTEVGRGDMSHIFSMTIFSGKVIGITNDNNFMVEMESGKFVKVSSKVFPFGEPDTFEGPYISFYPEHIISEFTENPKEGEVKQ